MNESKFFRFGQRDYPAHIREMYETGASYVPGFLQPKALKFVQNLVTDLESYIVPAENKAGSNYHIVDWGKLDFVQYMPILFVMQQVSDLVVSEGREFDSLSNFGFNEAPILRYYDDSLVKPHRDHAGYEQVGVTVSIQGRADFHIHQEEDGPPVSTWRVKPGDAVFLRMTGFNPNIMREEEVFHSVGAPLSKNPRTSIAFRQYVDPAKAK